MDTISVAVTFFRYGTFPPFTQLEERDEDVYLINCSKEDPMKIPMQSPHNVGRPQMATLALLQTLTLLWMGCGGIEEMKNNFDSRGACQSFCTKRFECESKNSNDSENDICTSSCRNSIENNCGNEHQAAANDKIQECVDKGCVNFTTCMAFSASPSCFGFVNKM